MKKKIQYTFKSIGTNESISANSIGILKFWLKQVASFGIHNISIDEILFYSMV